MDLRLPVKLVAALTDGLECREARPDDQCDDPSLDPGDPCDPVDQCDHHGDHNFNPGDLSLVIVAGAAEGSEALPVSRVERGRSREVHPPADH